LIESKDRSENPSKTKFLPSITITRKMKLNQIREIYINLLIIPST
jgi:hypothetical protein